MGANVLPDFMNYLQAMKPTFILLITGMIVTVTSCTEDGNPWEDSVVSCYTERTDHASLEKQIEDWMIKEGVLGSADPSDYKALFFLSRQKTWELERALPDTLQSQAIEAMRTWGRCVRNERQNHLWDSSKSPFKTVSVEQHGMIATDGILSSYEGILQNEDFNRPFFRSYTLLYACTVNLPGAGGHRLELPQPPPPPVE